jgi:hypothetical protein
MLSVFSFPFYISDAEWIGGEMDQLQHSLLWRSGPEEGVQSKRAGAHSCLQTGGG